MVTLLACAALFLNAYVALKILAHKKEIASARNKKAESSSTPTHYSGSD